MKTILGVLLLSTACSVAEGVGGGYDDYGAAQNATNGITSAQIQAMFPGVIVTNGHSIAVTLSNGVSVEGALYADGGINAFTITNGNTSGNKIQRTDTNGKLGDASAGVHYCAATSGSSILKGNSGNTISAAFSDVQSLAPGLIVTNGESQAITLSNTFTIDASHSFNAALGVLEADAIGTTVTTAANLTNGTAGTSGNPQYSPALTFAGNGFNTTGSTNAPGYFQIYDSTLSGASAIAQRDLHVLKIDYVGNGTRVNCGTLSAFGVFTANDAISSAGGNVSAASTFALVLSTRSKISSPTDGDLILAKNNQTTGFNRLIFGSSAANVGTNAWPAIYVEASTNNPALSIRTGGTNNGYYASLVASNLNLASDLSVSNLTASRIPFVGADLRFSSSSASGAVPIDADGSATTAGQLQTLVGGVFTTNNGTLTSGQLLTGAGNRQVQTGDLSGDVTTSGSTATTIAAQSATAVPNNTGGWTEFKVSGSDFTRTAQTLADVTGLVSGTLSTSSLYEIDAMLYCTSSSSAGVEFGVNCTGTGSPACGVVFNGATTTTAAAVSSVNALNSAEATAFLTGSQTSVVILHGWVLTGTGSPAISIQGLKVTSGTLTVKIGSTLRIRKK